MIISAPNRDADSQIWYQRKKIGYLIPAIFDISKVQRGRGQSTPFSFVPPFPRWRRFGGNGTDGSNGGIKAFPQRETGLPSHMRNRKLLISESVLSAYEIVQYGMELYHRIFACWVQIISD